MKNTFTLLVCMVVLNLIQAQTYTQMTQPAHSSTFTGNTRGYYFTAPTCFTITAAMVPTEASTGNQSIAIVRLQSIPPLYATTTNNFDVLFLAQNSTDLDTMGMNILVNQGDIIGILASRGTSNSYAPAGFSSDINGLPVTLNRLGMQFQLASTAPQQLWTENGGSISRLFLYYDTLMLYNLSSTNVGANYTFNVGMDTMYTSMYTVWNYGDGSPLDTVYQPTHTFAANGTYNVCCYVNTACGVDTLCTSVNICDYAATANFSNADNGLDVNFTDLSTQSTAWYWDFGDGNTSTAQNPAHTYLTAGTYNVTQIVSTPCGYADTIIIPVTVCESLNAGFTNLNTGLSVDFTDLSSGANSWAWDFGDGNTSTTANPSNTYTSIGWYNISLIVSNSCGESDTIIDSIFVCTPPVAGFTVNSNGIDSISVTDISNYGSEWDWDFGDGNTDTTQNPTHVYISNGSYAICLTATNACGNSTICDSVLLCPDMPTAAFNYVNNVFSSNFTNTSGFDASSLWNFGDGNISSASDPNHTYTAAGTYFVCLTSFNLCGDSAVFCDSVSIAGNVGLEEISEMGSFNFYPNPTHGPSTIFIYSPENLEGSLVMMDITGRVVVAIHSGIFTTGNSTFTINTSSWTEGIYLLVWNTEKWSLSKKILVN